MTVVEAREVKKTYPTKPPVEALKGLSLEVEEGETLCLLGPNGAGKTTFLRILTGLLVPEYGWIRIFGRDVIRSRKFALSLLRFLPESPFLLRGNTLWENASFWFSYWNEPLPRDALAEIFTKIGLISRANEPLSRFSRGMLQKAALSLMLATKAPVVILDEPTLGLDVLAVRDVVEMINGLKEKRKTVIVASHSMTFVEEIADRVALVDQGRVLEVERVQDFVMRHGNPRFSIVYKDNHGDEMHSESFDNRHECDRRLEALLREGVELLEVRRECDSLEQILRQLLGRLRS
ncbi:MAG: ABC transporter ATP-binding protein [bacterium]